MAYQKVIFSSRLGKDATFGAPSGNGRTPVRFSLPYTENSSHGEEVTWFNVVYWASSDREVDYLKSMLMKAAVVMIEGKIKLRRSMHHEFPIEVVSAVIEATFLDVVAPAKAQPVAAAEAEPARPSAPPAVDFGISPAAPSRPVAPARPPRAPDPGYAQVPPTHRESAMPLPVSHGVAPTLTF